VDIEKYGLNTFKTAFDASNNSVKRPSRNVPQIRRKSCNCGWSWWTYEYLL